MSTGDLHYLLGLGVTIEELAVRTGRTVTAIKAELAEDDGKEWNVR